MQQMIAFLTSHFLPNFRQRYTLLTEAPAKFPEGLNECVRRIKEDYGVQYVGVWHTLAGYVNGLHPDSNAYILIGETDRYTGIASREKKKVLIRDLI